MNKNSPTSAKRVFLDTEFTSYQHPKLVSLALVPEESLSVRPLYLEIAWHWDDWEVSDFTRQTVFPLLDQPKKTPIDQVGEIVARYFEKEIIVPCIAATDSLQFDWIPLVYLMKRIPANVDRNPLLLTPSYLNDFDRFDQEMQNGFKRVKQHHALNDAMVARHAWEVSGRDTLYSNA
jgi:hypothetical protein